MTPTNRLNQLREVKVRNIHTHSFVRFDFVEQISSFGEFERKPYPRLVFAGGQELNDVCVPA